MPVVVMTLPWRRRRFMSTVQESVSHDPLPPITTMIKCIWHGWTTPANADRYERLLLEEAQEGRRHRRGHCTFFALFFPREVTVLL